MMRTHRRIPVPVAAALFACLLVSGLIGSLPASASHGSTVNSTADAVDANLSDGVCDSDLAANGLQCTLRAAVQESNVHGGTDTITVQANTYTLTLLGSDDTAAAGDLDLTDSVNIVGAGASTTIVEADSPTFNYRIFHVVSTTTTASFSGLTIRDANTSESGGGIFSVGNTTIANSSFTGNQACSGGAILNGSGGIDATMSITSSTFTGNSSNGGCGAGNAIWNWEGSMTIDQTTVDSNGSASAGGDSALTNSATMTITRSTVSNNTAVHGGGLSNGCCASQDVNDSVVQLTATNVTIHGNTSTNLIGGGFLQRTGSSTFTNSTITGNSGHGMAVLGGTSFTLKNTIIANQSSGQNCNAAFVTSQGNNMESANTCQLNDDINNNPDLTDGDWINTDPQLGALAENGGPTKTRELPSTSPAIDRGNNTGCPATDQRGVARPQDGDGNASAICDIGAYERAAPTPPTQHLLTVTKQGSGAGSVTGTGISCGDGTTGDCTESYNEGTAVVLTAAEGANSTFGSWSGCDSTSGSQCTVTMTAAKSVTATFNLVQRALTVAKQGTGAGSVTGTGISCGDGTTGDCNESYNHGTAVVLTAAEGANSTFGGWSGCDSTSGSQCTVTMTAAKSVAATFNSAVGGGGEGDDDDRPSPPAPLPTPSPTPSPSPSSAPSPETPEPPEGCQRSQGHMCLTPGDDVIAVTSYAGLVLTIFAGPGDDKVCVNPSHPNLTVVFYGGEGNDELVIPCPSGPPFFRGSASRSAGSSELSSAPGSGAATPVERVIAFGEGGNDAMVGGTAADRLAGGPGVDVLRGFAGNDRLSGGAEADQLFGGGGKDRLKGGPGGDSCAGGGGADIKKSC